MGGKEKGRDAGGGGVGGDGGEGRGGYAGQVVAHAAST